MNTNFTLELRQDYVHVQLEPGYQVTSDSLSRLWPALKSFCQEHNRKQVLCEGKRPQRQMSAKEEYDFGITVSKDLTVLEIACYWEDYKPDHQTDMFKQVTHNRGVNIQFFPTREAALQWLCVADTNAVAEVAA